MFTYESLDIWKLAIVYAKKIYQITNQFPKSEYYGLNNQLRRAAWGAGETLLDETWRSNYKPWQAVYLVGTQ